MEHARQLIDRYLHSHIEFEVQRAIAELARRDACHNLSDVGTPRLARL